jgi:hypothetical protein
MALAVVLCLVLAGSGGAEEQTLAIGGAAIHVKITGQASVPPSALTGWIESSTRAVTAYFGRFPVPEVRLEIRAGTKGGVGHGVTFGGRVPLIRIQVGRAADETALRDDWVLTHEMAHLAFPNLTTDDSWAEEGLATYVEPLARARLGLLSEDDVWSGLIRGLPQGTPRPGDRGLHGTDDWGRTYWGGALFWLLADVRIREQTRNRLGLEDALAGILADRGDIRANWELERALTAGDRAVSLTVLSDLYRQLGTSSAPVDLGDLWRRLGVKQASGRLSYDDAAVLAHVRRGIVGASDEAARSLLPASGLNGTSSSDSARPARPSAAGSGLASRASGTSPGRRPGRAAPALGRSSSGGART